MDAPLSSRSTSVMLCRSMKTITYFAWISESGMTWQNCLAPRNALSKPAYGLQAGSPPPSLRLSSNPCACSSVQPVSRRVISLLRSLGGTPNLRNMRGRVAC